MKIIKFLFAIIPLLVILITIVGAFSVACSSIIYGILCFIGILIFAVWAAFGIIYFCGVDVIELYKEGKNL